MSRFKTFADGGSLSPDDVNTLSSEVDAATAIWRTMRVGNTRLDQHGHFGGEGGSWVFDPVYLTPGTLALLGTSEATLLPVTGGAWTTNPDSNSSTYSPQTQPWLHYLDPQDYGGRKGRLRWRLSLVPNDRPFGANLTFALYGASVIGHKQHIDPFAPNFVPKAAVKAATTANITLSGSPQTLDGISCSTGDRVLVKNQTANENNGIYVVQSGAWTRATDLDTWAEVAYAFVTVTQGTTLATSQWWSTNTFSGGTLGTTNMNWSLWNYQPQGWPTISGSATSLPGSAFTTAPPGPSGPGLLAFSGVMPMPVAGHYVMGLTVDTVPASDSAVLVRAELQFRSERAT